MKGIRLREGQYVAIQYDGSKESIEELLSIIEAKHHTVKDETLYIYTKRGRFEFELNSWAVVGNKNSTILDEHDFNMFFTTDELTKGHIQMIKEQLTVKK